MSYPLQLAISIIGCYLFYRLVRVIARRIERLIIKIFPNYQPQMHWRTDVGDIPLPYGYQMPGMSKRRRRIERAILIAAWAALLVVVWLSGGFYPL